MNRSATCAVAWLACIGVPAVARAEPTACGARFYDEVLAWVGGSTTAIPSVGARAGAGLRYDACDAAGGAQVRLGATVEGLKRQSRSGGEAAVGGELEASWALPGASWRVGPRAAYGLALVEPGGSDGTRLVTLGMRLRHGDLAIGLDLLHATAPTADQSARPVPYRAETVVAVGVGIAPTSWKPALVTLGLVAAVIVSGLVIGTAGAN